MPVDGTNGTQTIAIDVLAQPIGIRQQLSAQSLINNTCHSALE